MNITQKKIPIYCIHDEEKIQTSLTYSRQELKRKEFKVFYKGVVEHCLLKHYHIQ